MSYVLQNMSLKFMYDKPFSSYKVKTVVKLSCKLISITLFYLLMYVYRIIQCRILIWKVYLAYRVRIKLLSSLFEHNSLVFWQVTMPVFFFHKVTRFRQLCKNKISFKITFCKFWLNLLSRQQVIKNTLPFCFIL